jgi:hypothetical protein
MGMNKLPPTVSIWLSIEDQSYSDYVINPATPIDIQFAILCPTVAGEIKDATIRLQLPYLKNAGAASTVNLGKFEIYNITNSTWDAIDDFGGHPFTVTLLETVQYFVRSYNYWYHPTVVGLEVKDYLIPGQAIQIRLSNVYCSAGTVTVKCPYVEMILQTS